MPALSPTAKPLTDESQTGEDSKRNAALGPRLSGTKRLTEPPNQYSQSNGGGIAFIPRRGVQGDFQGLLTTRAGLERFAAGSPLRLLSLLPDVHPTFGLAVWNAIRLSCPTDGLRLAAFNPVTSLGKKKAKAAPAPEKDDPDSDEEIEGEENDQGTALIEAFFAAQPRELGGQHGLQTSLTLALLFSGWPIMECVPGPRLTGLRRVFPIDSLTCRMNRQGEDGDISVYQMQRFPRSTNGKPGRAGGYVLLPPERVIWRTIDSAPDDPYGRAPYAPAVAEILRDLGMMQDITDAIHFAAYPRPAVGFNFAETYKIAVEVLHITDPLKAQVWVQEQFQMACKEMNKLKPDQAFFFDSNGSFNIKEGSSGFTALKEILVFLRQRIQQAVKSLPTLLGINDGATQTYTSVEWTIYAQGLETVRGIVAQMMADAMSLHLRLLGLPLICKPVYEPIRTTDMQMEANAESTRIKNEAMKVALGWQNNDQASNAITGSDAVAEPNWAAAGMGGTSSSSSSSSGTGTGTGEDKGKGDLPTAGTTQEEQDQQ